MYLTDTHDGDSTDGLVTVSAGDIIPYDKELINLQQGYNKTTGIKVVC